MQDAESAAKADKRYAVASRHQSCIDANANMYVVVKETEIIHESRAYERSYSLKT